METDEVHTVSDFRKKSRQISENRSKNPERKTFTQYSISLVDLSFEIPYLMRGVCCLLMKYADFTFEICGF